MPLIQRRAKLNDFLFSRRQSSHKPSPTSLSRTVLAPTFGSKGNYLTEIGRRDGEYIYLYHQQKTGRKYAHGAKCCQKERSNRYPAGNSNIIREGYWDTRLFRIPVELVKRAVQYQNHFVLELK